MKWIRFCSAVVALVGLSATAQAGVLGLFNGHGAGKSCGCAPTHQPACCKPTIAKPCDVSVHTYQRKCSDIKPPCCVKQCAPKACCAPVAKPCAAPVAKPCPAPQPVCAAPAKSCCPTRCCDADPCEIAELIYESQTACYARHRARALRRLGRFDCVCNPEIMAAFVYGLNDADERVRRRAANEIGDQFRKNPCCCSPEVVGALTTALADCDRRVRRQATRSLKACGYEVVDSCCQTACGPCGHGAPAPAPAPMDDAAPAPAPPEDPKAYFPSQIRQQHSSKGKIRSSLSGLFGFLN